VDKVIIIANTAGDDPKVGEKAGRKRLMIDRLLTFYLL
jgi:hypothetical protein